MTQAATYTNACDMTSDERQAATASWFDYVEKRKALCMAAYAGTYRCDEGGTPYFYGITGHGFLWSHAPIIHDAADAYIAGYRDFLVRCGGSHMRCAMEDFPVLVVVEQLNTDNYGFRGLGAKLRPEECNEVKRFDSQDKDQ